MKKTLFYVATMATMFLTACEKVDDVQLQESSKEKNYAARLSSSLVSLDDAKSIAARLIPGTRIPLECSDGTRFPIFTQQQLDGVLLFSMQIIRLLCIYSMRMMKGFCYYLHLN